MSNKGETFIDQSLISHKISPAFLILGDKYKYIGNDGRDSKANKGGREMFKLHTNADFPPHRDNCVCGHDIEYNYYVMHEETKDIKVVGSECYNSFPNRNRTCPGCGICVDRTHYNMCKNCSPLITFGKFKGKRLLEIIEFHPSYICWCFKEENPSGSILSQIIIPILKFPKYIEDEYIYTRINIKTYNCKKCTVKVPILYDCYQCNPSNNEIVYEYNGKWVPARYKCISCHELKSDKESSKCENCKNTCLECKTKQTFLQDDLCISCRENKVKECEKCSIKFKSIYSDECYKCGYNITIACKITDNKCTKCQDYLTINSIHSDNCHSCRYDDRPFGMCRKNRGSCNYNLFVSCKNCNHSCVDCGKETSLSTDDKELRCDDCLEIKSGINSDGINVRYIIKFGQKEVNRYRCFKCCNFSKRKKLLI